MKYAAITAIPLSLLFLWADRYRPQRFWVWLMTFGWGACVATYFSAQVNTWAASQLSIIGDGDPATGARAAIFVAPWVEEFAKGTVLFWLAILMRYQWVSRLSGIVLAGLSGAAFAFVENILYYGRAYRYASRTFGEVPPLEALQSLFMLRGVMTFFGHPLFTAMTGIGLAVGLRSKSKVVRVVAPLAGYTAAAFLHMAFNSSASLLQGTNLLLIYLLVALPLVIAVIVFTVRQVLHEGRLIRTRLGDYVRLGWLSEGDPVPLSRLRTRGKALWHGVFAGPDVLLATIRLQRSVTELAYLRDAMTRGLVDTAGLEREKLLLHKVYGLRGSRSSRRPVGRRTRPSAGAEPSKPPRRTHPRASPDRPDSVATIPRHPPRPIRVPQHPWGRLLPSTPRSTPPGSHPVSELTVAPMDRPMSVHTARSMGRRSNGRSDGGSGDGAGDGPDRPARHPHRGPAADRPAGDGGAALGRRRPGASAGRLRAAPARDHRRALARRRRGLHRSGQVDAWSTRWSVAGSPLPA